MPRTITIHPLSLALGLVVGGLCLLSMSQVTVSTPLRVEYIPHPKDMVQISGAQPYTVPTGKILVITAFGSVSAAFGGTSIWINGQQEFALYVPFMSGAPIPQSETTVVQLPSCLSVQAGSVVTLTGPCTTPPCPDPTLRIWGYVVNQ